ncbi:RNA-binding protein [Allopseudospirillum japonicum]|uniref:RNA-binding protein n=1 Tax=Allopseudospirillum japonicum TaxID=64971 RepID=A0A1H6UAQ9_9GAMM|nr:ribosome assembly RNA-binding protein YhbY [Allopseudospirillum japonicum]SEI88646.1 RNA-binding protein [Allopseudospirillum japonicum]
MSLSNDQKKHFRSIGHQLNPVVLVAEKGLTTGVIAEIERALQDHELIKVRFSISDREQRDALIEQAAQQVNALIVQKIGKVVLYYRKAAKPNAKLSNLTRFSD